MQLPHHFMIFYYDVASIGLKKPIKSEAGDEMAINGEFECFERVNPCKTHTIVAHQKHCVRCCNLVVASLGRFLKCSCSQVVTTHIFMYFGFMVSSFFYLYDCHVATLHCTSNFISVWTRVRKLKLFSIRFATKSLLPWTKPHVVSKLNEFQVHKVVGLVKSPDNMLPN